jgi:hypothetical protein
MMNYCNEIESFINYAPSNSMNISRGGIRCPRKSCKNKKFLNPYVVMMHLLQKKIHKKNICVGLHMENPMFLIRIW